MDKRKSNKEMLDVWFKYHPPQPGQIPHYEALREAALVFAKAIVDHTPEAPDQTAALRKVREAVMTANAGLACSGWDGDTYSADLGGGK
jgi:hypothetical protein